METYETLEKALALIEPEGNWVCGNEGMDGGPGLCAEGALGRVLGIVGRDYDAIHATDAYRALQNALPGFNRIVFMFNDHHSHTEVVALFMKAIRQEKQKAGITVDLPTTQPVTEAVA